MEHVENQGPSEGLASLSAGGSASTVGATLRKAREAKGLSLPDIAAQTRIAERHLAAIEEDRLGDLAARTYAVGFSRTYARALGLDDKAIAEQVRRQLDAEGHSREPVMVPHFEPGDPARVPSVRLAWVAAAGALVVIVLLLVFWSSYLAPEGKLPDLISDAPKPAPSAVVAAKPAAPAVQPTNGPVVLAATVEGVWLRVTDAKGKLVEKVLKQGETWTVPEGAQAPQLRTGRPDGLAITVGGKAIPALAAKPMTMSGVSLVPADLLARGQAGAPAGATGIAAPTAAVPTAGPTVGPNAGQTAAPLSTTSQ